MYQGWGGVGWVMQGWGGVHHVGVGWGGKKCNHKIRVQECNGGGATSRQWRHVTSSARYGGGGVCHTGGGSVMESYQFEIFDQYFSVIVTIPHISIKTESLCIPTYFSVYLKPREVIIMHKIHLKTFLSSRRRHPWRHTIMAGTRDGPRQPVPCRPVPPVGLAPMTAPHPQNNLISINYYNLWLYPLNVVGGLIWIGKKIIKKFYLSLVMVYKTFLHSYTSPHIYSWIFKTLWVIIFWVRVTCKMLNLNWEKIHSIILSVTCHGLINFPLLMHINSYSFKNFLQPMSYYFLS